MLFGLSIIFSVGVLAQSPPLPPTDPTSGGNQNPGNAPTGAPLDPGTGITLLLAAGYGLFKVNQLKRRKLQEL